jgi:hypothetical protein
MRLLFIACLTLSAAVVAEGLSARAAPAPTNANLTRLEAALDRHETLQPITAFDGIVDPNTRSVALYTEAFKVIGNPRCQNCHPKDGMPRQGPDSHPHNPTIAIRDGDHVVGGPPCASCHGAANYPVWGEDTRSIPGNPKWALAPAAMAWQGKTPGEICRQIKDPSRNGGRSTAQLFDHMAHDGLVGWAWSPGAGRAPAPGTQAEFGALVQAWIDSGARCPA